MAQTSRRHGISRRRLLASGGAGVLGDPLVSLGWLVERLAAHGHRVEAGQIVLSGSFIRPVEAQGSRIVGDFGSFGRVSCRFL